MKVPELKDNEEAAAFFGKHGLDEYYGDTQEAEVQARRPLSTVLSVRLDNEHLARLKTLAKAEGRGVTTMARLLLSKAIDAQGELPSAAQSQRLADEIQALKRRVEKIEARSA